MEKLTSIAHIVSFELRIAVDEPVVAHVKYFIDGDVADSVLRLCNENGSLVVISETKLKRHL